SAYGPAAPGGPLQGRARRGSRASGAAGAALSSIRADSATQHYATSATPHLRHRPPTQPVLPDLGRRLTCAGTCGRRAVFTASSPGLSVSAFSRARQGRSRSFAPAPSKQQTPLAAGTLRAQSILASPLRGA